ncbi:MAG TPA: hypothetical protein VLS27_06190 [Gammaproteobacteria bacterium]|nr:hypothetical protein [Gammaproteobacteria bacterium]
MSGRDEDRALAGAQSFLRVCKLRQRASSELLARGRAARVLAASKPGGLLLNVEAPELSFFLADGMDIASQLISVIRDAAVHATLKELLRDDIRISVHAQHPGEFLGDVRDHRFDLMIFGELEPPVARLAAAILAPGGLLAIFRNGAHGDTDGEELEQSLTDCGLLISPGAGRSLLAAHAPDHRRAKRRGGRRKRPPFRG